MRKNPYFYYVYLTKPLPLRFCLFRSFEYTIRDVYTFYFWMAYIFLYIYVQLGRGSTHFYTNRERVLERETHIYTTLPFNKRIHSISIPPSATHTIVIFLYVDFFRFQNVHALHRYSRRRRFVRSLNVSCIFVACDSKWQKQRPKRSRARKRGKKIKKAEFF